MIEQRLVKRMENYWNLLRKESDLPEYERFNKDVIEDIWDRCIVMESRKESSKNAFFYDFIGSDLKNILGREHEGEKVILAHGFKPAKDVLDTIKSGIYGPTITEGQFISESSKLVKYRSCLLPFGKSLKMPTHLIVGFSWHEF